MQLEKNKTLLIVFHLYSPTPYIIHLIRCRFISQCKQGREHIAFTEQCGSLL